MSAEELVTVGSRRLSMVSTHLQKHFESSSASNTTWAQTDTRAGKGAAR